MKTRLSEGLEDNRKSLNLEVDRSQFARPIEVFTFLSEELSTRELEKHTSLSFNPKAEAKRVNELKQESSDFLDIGNLKVIDRYGKILNNLLSQKGFWSEKDYRHQVGIISRFFEEIFEDSKGNIQRNDLHGLRGSIVVIDSMNIKLKNHLPNEPSKTHQLVQSYSDKIDTMLTDMESLLAVDAFDRLSAKFSDFQALMLDVSIKNSGTHDANSILSSFDKKCTELQFKFHELLLQYTKDKLDSFHECMKKENFKEARDLEGTLRDLR